MSERIVFMSCRHEAKEHLKVDNETYLSPTRDERLDRLLGVAIALLKLGELCPIAFAFARVMLHSAVNGLLSKGLCICTRSLDAFALENLAGVPRAWPGREDHPSCRWTGFL